MYVLLRLKPTGQVGPTQEGLAGEPDEPPGSLTPPPDLEEQPRRSGRRRQFPQIWRDFEATSYSPVVMVPQVTEQVFEERVIPHTVPTLLAPPDLAQPSPNRSPPDSFHLCQVFDVHPNLATADGQGLPILAVPPHVNPPSHPFTSDSAFELVKTFVLGPSSKTVSGMDEIAGAILSGRVIPSELSGFKATTELRRLDDFAARSPIAGGPWLTGSVKVKMPCMRANNPPSTTETGAPEFEIPGVRYRSLVDIVVSKVTDPSSSGSFMRQPFTEWWCLPGGDRPIRIYGEAYSSDIAVQLSEEIKGIPPSAEHPQIEDVVVMLMLGSDATHLANFGTASLWPIYVFFGNMSKYDSSKPSEFPACHLAYLPKVCANATSIHMSSALTTVAPAA